MADPSTIASWRCVTFITLVASWFNWGCSLVFGAVLAIEVARRVEGVDYCALAAASVLSAGGVGQTPV